MCPKAMAVQAYCLMPNHFIWWWRRAADLGGGDEMVFGTYTGRFNRRHKLFGHLFSGRYKSLIVDGSGSGYLRTVCEYVHLNPARAKTLRRNRRYGSTGGAVGRSICGRQETTGLVAGDASDGGVGIPQDMRRGGGSWSNRWKQGERPRTARPTTDSAGMVFRRQALKQELLGQMSKRLGPEHYGQERQESQMVQAEQVVKEELRRRRWTETTLGSGRKARLRR